MISGTSRIAVTLFVLSLAAGCAKPRIVDLAEATSPTPYTAQQIRDANPPGTRIVHRIEREGEPTVLSIMTFVQGDYERAVIEGHTQTLEGLPYGQSKRSVATWAELRDHAAFKRPKTQRSEAAITVPAGKFWCKLYTVSGEEDGVPTTNRYYFARSRPGPPVLYEVEKLGRVTMTMKLVEDTRR